MSLRKIIFLIIISIVGVVALIGIIVLRNSSQNKVTVPDKLTIWITEGSTELYEPLIEGFAQYAPEYSRMKIQVEKKTSDPIRYRTLLLSTLSDGTGPDIYMLKSGEDRILESKRGPIPTSLFPSLDFERNYEDIFLHLLTGSLEDTNILGIPIGYETLGIFYNKSLMKEIPKTWDEIESLYNSNAGIGIFPTNLGLGPRYTPNSADIFPIFFKKETSSFQDLATNNNVLNSYFSYAQLKKSGENQENLGGDETITSKIPVLENKKFTTLDSFMMGEIGFIVGYPSIVVELEKSVKRVGGFSVEDIILTGKIPQETLGQRKKNTARFTYFSLSKDTDKALAGAKFLEYLTTDDALRDLQKIYPYYIPPKPSLYESWKNSQLSPVLSRTKLDVFIPEVNETLMYFDYGLKAEFLEFLSENIDRSENIDIDNLGESLASFINCTISTLEGETLSECEK